ncbi:MAG: helix-turn-helix domain-containing protein [Bacteroidota bacterium]
MAPSQAHHSFIRKIWILENTSTLFKRNTGFLVGDGRFELAFVQGNGYRTYRAKTVETFRKGIYLGGQMNRPLDVELLPETHITFIKLEPWALSLLSNFNFKESLNHTVPFQEVSKSLYRKLIGLHPIVDQQKILDILSQELEDRAKTNWEWQLIRQACLLFDAQYTDFKGAKTKIVSKFQKSSRTVETKFGRAVGLSPQQYSIGMRFRNFSEELKHTAINIALTDLAYKHGYYDQSHLNQDFKQYWGFSPKQLNRKKVFITNQKEAFRYYTI